MNLHLGLDQEVLVEQTVQKGCTVPGVNLIEIKTKRIHSSPSRVDTSVFGEYKKEKTDP